MSQTNGAANYSLEFAAGWPQLAADHGNSMGKQLAFLCSAQPVQGGQACAGGCAQPRQHCDCSHLGDQRWQQQCQCAAGNGIPGPAGPCAASSSGRVTVHVLGADDAYPPLLALARGNGDAAAGGSPRAPTAAAATPFKQASCTLPQPNGQRQQQRGQQVCAAQPLQEQLLSAEQAKPLQGQPGGSVYDELSDLLGPAAVHHAPQLLLVYGQVLSLAGYPPFHTRSAEIQWAGSCRQASSQGLAAALAMYSASLQRHGK